jgi:RNA polymerase sigma-70 factor (ECF subfamily)
MIAETAIVSSQPVVETTHRDTFLRLVQQYEPALRRLAGAYLEQAADREDLFQEIAVALWQAIPRFRGESSERTWLYRIAHNVAITATTRVRGRSKREEPISEPFEQASHLPSAEQDLLHREKQQWLIEAVRQLPVVDRQIILLHLEGLSYAEIETISGLSETAIATRLSRTREKLRSQIQRKEVQSR